MRRSFLLLLTLATATLATVPAAAQSTVGVVADLRPGSEGSDPRLLTSVGNALYFSADDGGHGRELWRLTGGSPELVADLNPGAAASSPDLGRYGDRLIITADNGTGRALWRVDAGVVVPVAGGEGVEFQFTGAALGERALLRGSRAAEGQELWVIEGDHVRLLQDIRPGPDSSVPHSFRTVGGLAYFVATDAQGEALWATDGDSAWAASRTPAGSGITDVLPVEVYDGRLYVLATTPERGRELWVADSAGAVRPLPETRPGPDGFSTGFGGAAVFNGALYVLDSSLERGDVLWEVQGETLAGSVEVSPPAPSGALQYGALVRGVAQGALWLDQYDDTSGERRGVLLRGDGHTFAPVHPFVTNDDPIGSFLGLADRAYYTVDDAQYGSGVFEVGPDSVQHLDPGYPYEVRSLLVRHGGTLYFNGEGGASGRELWAVTPLAVATETPPRTGAPWSIRSVYPNPAEGAATVEVVLSRPAALTLEVFDALGRRVHVEEVATQAPGAHALPLRLAGLRPGAYVVRLVIEGATADTRQVTVGR